MDIRRLNLSLRYGMKIQAIEDHSMRGTIADTLKGKNFEEQPRKK